MSYGPDISPGSTDVSTVVRLRNADGTPADGVEGAVVHWQRIGGADAYGAGDYQTTPGGHSDLLYAPMGDGYYRVDVPDSAFVAGADWVMVWLEASGKTCDRVVHRIRSAEAEAWSYAERTLTSPSTTSVVSPQKGSKTVVEGDAYTSSPSRPLVFTKASGETWPTLTDGPYVVTLYLTLNTDNADADSGTTTELTLTTCTVISDTVVHAFLTAAQTALLFTGAHAYDYQLRATKGSEAWTLETGTLDVMASLAA